MLVIDEEKAKIVRNIFDWYLEGASIIGIKRKLEMAARSNVQVTEKGTFRKNRKCSSKRKNDFEYAIYFPKIIIN